jgi:hypothetical protein
VLPGGLAGVVDGLARLRAYKVSGQKLVVRPQESPEFDGVSGYAQTW